MKKWLLVFIGLLVTYTVHCEPLPANKAFSLQIQQLDPNTFKLQWAIEHGYFLYGDRIKINTTADSNVTLGSLRLPRPEHKTDKQGHVYSIYRNQLIVPVDVLGGYPGESLLHLSYQGCSDEGFCYPVEEQDIKVVINTQNALTAVALEQPLKVTPPALAMNETEEISQLFNEHHWLVLLFIFYGFGLLLSCTPCIFPMVPVLSGIIVGHGKDITTKKAFFLSLSYVLSMSLTYAAIGAITAVLGSNLQINMQSPWAISIFSILFVLLALSMFGFYELKLPNAWQEKIAGSSATQRGGHYFGAALMGALSTLILSPCVTAPLIGVLSYIAQSHNLFLGCFTLFSLSLGMGTPLLFIGMSAGRLLPKTGSWMNHVKVFFGVLLLGVAIYLLARIIPVSITMLLWAFLLINYSVYVGAFSPVLNSQGCIKKGLGLILFIYGVLILIGMSMGANDPLQPLIRVTKPVIEKPVIAQTLQGIEKQIKEAHGQPIVLDFYADWCASCNVIEATVLQDSKVQEQLKSVTFIKIDLTKNTAEDQKIMHHFNVIAPPTFIFFNAQGTELNSLKTVGEVSTTQFMRLVQQAGAE